MTDVPYRVICGPLHLFSGRAQNQLEVDSRHQIECSPECPVDFSKEEDFMLANRNEKHHWGVILAGGDGTRLKSLTHLVSNDDRPKQFCPLLNGKTLLAETRLRIARSVDPGRTLFVLNRAHES